MERSGQSILQVWPASSDKGSPLLDKSNNAIRASRLHPDRLLTQLLLHQAHVALTMLFHHNTNTPSQEVHGFHNRLATVLQDLEVQQKVANGAKWTVKSTESRSWKKTLGNDEVRVRVL